MKLYNTQAKQKRDFVPLDPQHVTIYVCGPTVYSYAHIGNARPAVVFDVLVRVLRHLYPAVTYVRNITDIDDKINKAAAEQSVDISVISQKYTDAYHHDLKQLGVLAPDVEPKVTEHIAEIHGFIQSLIDQGHAYEAEGHVLFSVASYAEYGDLSKRDADELLAGARVDVAPYKQSPGDFVLWKPSTADQPGWDSPWGRGRPGWHIECSAMSAAHLGKTIDIHGGGHDLIFPHHENERAQSTCAHGGEQYVRYWVHNGFVNVNREKMSKSIGNVLLVKDLLEQAPGEAIRYALMSAQYRAPLDWSDEALAQAKSSLDRVYGALRDMADIAIVNFDSEQTVLPEAFMAALKDDLNTPKALAEVFNLVRQANSSSDDQERSMLKTRILACGELLGLFQQNPNDWFAYASESVDAAEIDTLIAQRIAARDNKDWALADEIRDKLNAMNVVLEDGANGTRWRIES